MIQRHCFLNRVATAACILLGWILPVQADEDIYDRFYHDDTSATLNFIPGKPAVTQIHNFWNPGDEDWIVFNIDPLRVYSVLVKDQASSCDAAIYLFHESNITTPLLQSDLNGPGLGQEDVYLFTDAMTSGTVFVKITQSPLSPGLSGEATTYTLRIEGSWGDNAGLGTISGTTRRIIGPPGDALCVMEDSPTTDFTYNRHQIVLPPGALHEDLMIGIGSPTDIGNQPRFSWTKAWLRDHPGNASIVFIENPPVTFSAPLVLTVQFLDDGPTTLGFTIDDVPSTASPQSMRIHTWNGSAWRVLESPQTVSTDTVSVSLTAFDVIDFVDVRRSFFAVAPTEPRTSVGRWRSFR